MKASEKIGSRQDLQGAERAGRVFLCALPPDLGTSECLGTPRQKNLGFCLTAARRRPIVIVIIGRARRSRRRRKALMVSSATLGNIPSRHNPQGAERAGRVFLCALLPVEEGRVTCLRAHGRWHRNSASGRTPGKKPQNCLDGGAERFYHYHNWARRSQRRRKAPVVPSSTLGSIPSRHNPHGAERAGRVFLCALPPVEGGRATCLRAHGRWHRNSASGRRRSCRPSGRAGYRPRPSPPPETTYGDRRTWPAPRNFSKPPGIRDEAKAGAAARRSDRTPQRPRFPEEPYGDALRRAPEAGTEGVAEAAGGPP